MKPRTQLRARLVAGLAVTALLATGCGSSSDDSDNSATPKDGGSHNSSLVTGLANYKDGGTPVDGGILRLADYAEPRSQDPANPIVMANGAVGGNTLAAMYDTLMKYDFEAKAWAPQLAESLTHDNDTTWTLKLRKNATFSDGTPVNADAVVASINRFLSSYGYNFLVWQANVTETKKVDEWTVQFTTRTKWASFPGMLSQGPGMIVAPAAYKDPANFKPIGAGAYLFKAYKPGEKLEVVANDKYWNGRPHLDGITWTWPGADAGKLESLKNGDVDGIFVRETNIVAQAVTKDKMPSFVFVSGAGATLNINQREGHPGANPNVRQAINYSLDPEVYFARSKNTDAVVNKQLTPATSGWYTKLADAGAADLDKAKAALAQAKKEGFDGKITYTHMGDPVSTSNATNIKAMLEATGFEVTMDPQQSVADQTKKVYIDYTYDLAMGALSIGQEDPYTGLAAPLLPKSPTNAWGYESADMVAALTELAAADTPEEGKPAMQKVEELWQKDVPAVNLADGNFASTYSDKVHGFEASTVMLVLFDKAWISK